MHVAHLLTALIIVVMAPTAIGMLKVPMIQKTIQ
jgi:hypothetical protein